MKLFLILTLTYVTTIVSTVNASEVYACLESGQESSFITAEFGKDMVTLKYINYGEVNGVKEVLKGTETDLSVTKSVTEDGDEVITIISIIDDENNSEKTNIRVLTCGEL